MNIDDRPTDLKAHHTCWRISNGHISATHYPIHCCMHTDHTLPSDSTLYNDGDSKLIS